MGDKLLRLACSNELLPDVKMETRRLRLGILVPSSNTTMEPLINAMLGTINAQSPSLHITAHFSRFRVKQVSLGAAAQSQFDLEKMLEAVSLLADAHVDAIGWGGTSAGWLGLDTDMKLCKAIEAQFNLPASTSTLSLIEILHELGDPKLGLLTPYIPEMNQEIRKTFATSSIRIVENDQFLGITDNHKIGEVTNDQLTHMIGRLLEAQKDVNVITTFCTNLNAACLAAAWERTWRDRDLIVLDSVATVVWGLLKKLGITMRETGIGQEWGRIFDV